VLLGPYEACHSLSTLVDLITPSANHIAESKLSLYLLDWGKSCSILDDRGRNPTDETFVQGVQDDGVRSRDEAGDQLGVTSSGRIVTKLVEEVGAAKVGVSVEQLSKARVAP